jgi:hypothetical protein
MNSVISAATIEARNSGWDVLGIMDGFQHLIEGRIEQARPLARQYMIRLDREDLADPEKLRPIAEASGLTPKACHDRYGYLAEG